MWTSKRRLLTRHTGVPHPGRHVRLLASGIYAAALLLVVPLAAQVPNDTASLTGTDTTSSPVPGDAPATARPASPTASGDAAAARAQAIRDSLDRAEAARNAKDGGWSRFPRPKGWAVLAVIFFGALGALAGDLVADGTRLDRWRRDDTGWTLGFPGRLLIGMVAAMIVVLGLRPPNASWPVLISTALAVGTASEAILLAVMASWKVRMAENETRRVRNAGMEQLEGLRVGMRAVHEAAVQGASGAGRALNGMESHPGAGLAEQVDRLAEQAKAEFLASTRHPAGEMPAAPPRVPSAREVHSRVFERSFTEVGDLGGRVFRTEAAAGRKEVVITYKVPDSDFSELLVDDVPIPSNGEGVHRAIVGPGEHSLHCRAQTRPNAEYEVEIADPAEARWKPDPPRTAAPSGIINDLQPFTTNG
jgi:hypothetical protein